MILMKRPRLEDVIVPGLSRDSKYEILKKADAKDAMNYAISGDRDIVELLRQDNIWRFWFQRDMAIVYTQEIPIYFPQEGEGPLWKRWYLWWRLTIGMYQWDIIGRQEILNAYPPNSTIRYVELNVLELTTPQGHTYLDFRTEFIRIMSTLVGDGFTYSIEHIKFVNISFLRAIATRYIIDDDNYVWNNLALHHRNHLLLLNSGIRTLLNNDLINDNHVFNEFPNMVFISKRIIVASCIQCGKSAEHQCSGPCGGIVFCNAACQANDWHSALCLIGGKAGKKKV
jgi:hypothetical protein